MVAELFMDHKISIIESVFIITCVPILTLYDLYDEIIGI